MSEDKIFEMVKSPFEEMNKEVLVEYLSALVWKLIHSGVSIGDCQLEPDYVEFVDDNGDIQKMPGRLGNRPIWDTLTLNFANHDAKIRKEFEDAEFHEEIEELKWRNVKSQKEIRVRQDEIEKLKKENDELKTENAELHCEMQAMMIFPDEFSTESIKVADMLIDNAMGAYNNYVEDFAKAYAGQLVIGNPCEDVKRQTVSYLRQIAEHLLVYCNANGEETE